MVQSKQIIFYTNKYSPYGQRVHMGLKEAKAELTLCDVDLGNKPDWFVPEVNPFGKIPALSYGGSNYASMRPAHDSFKTAESLNILEFLADLFPDAALRPKDPEQRARARHFMQAFEAEFVTVYTRVLFEGISPKDVIPVLEKIQKLLPETGFAAGEWSIADVAAAPILMRMMMLFEHDLGKYPVGEGKRLFAVLRDYTNFARLRKYIEDLKDRPSFKATYDEDVQLGGWREFAQIQRIKPQAA